MSNIIDGASSNGVFAIEQTGGKSKEPADKDARGRSNDQVIFIDSAKRLQAIERQLRKTPAVDKAKVEDIKQRIANGNLQISADNIARKLLEADKLFD